MQSTPSADSINELAVRLGWSAIERDHARDNVGNSYGAECQVPLANGRLLCSPAHPEVCDYVRVVQAGHELAYWTSDEWRDDPACVMGALMGCAKGPAPVALGQVSPLVESTAWRAAASGLPDGDYWYTTAGWDTQVTVRLETAFSSRKARMVRFGEGYTPYYLDDLPANARLMPRGH